MIIGIDLGTTNSLVAAWDGEQARILPNALGEFLTPSVVGLDDQGQLVVGTIARERLYTQPHLTASLFKRYMGSARETQLGAQRKATRIAGELAGLKVEKLVNDPTGGTRCTPSADFTLFQA